MKISNDFAVLQKDNALLIVAGQQMAKIYRLFKGEINQRETIEVEAPIYSDKPAFFNQKGRGESSASGSVHHFKKRYMLEKFIKELATQLSKMKRPFSRVYLFAPDYMMDVIKKELPKKVQERIRYEASGNFLKTHPTALLKKIKEIQAAKAVKEATRRVTTEAAKILGRGAGFPAQSINQIP